MSAVTYTPAKGFKMFKQKIANAATKAEKQAPVAEAKKPSVAEQKAALRDKMLASQHDMKAVYDLSKQYAELDTFA